jgi:C-terminal processing protease CtpA/Prc
MRKNTFKLLLGGLLVLCVACGKTVPQESSSSTDTTKLPANYYPNFFAFNIMNVYYLWADEVKSGLSKWSYGEDPVKKVASLRYKDGSGNEVDKWTELMEDYSVFQSAITGNGKTFGLEFVLIKNEKDEVGMVVTYTYAGSPAEKAGIKRGDIITTFNGGSINISNYADFLNEEFYYNPGTLELGLRDGRSIKLTAVQMYSNPVHTVKTLDVKGKKIGYLHFTSFTPDAGPALEGAFRKFKAEGVEELVLDLRYNTGGSVNTATALASMIAPTDVVESGSVFIKEVYNSILGASMGAETKFVKSLDVETSEGKKTTINSLEVNPGIKHLWAITTGHSASASEMILCGLAPYMDVTLVGSTTYGKFCGGYLIPAVEWFDAVSKEAKDLDIAAAKKATAGWGIYVIVSKYADRDGVTRSMPFGMPADYNATDNPTDGYELGDPKESMLSAVLALSTAGVYAAPEVKSVSVVAETLPFDKPGAGALIY